MNTTHNIACETKEKIIDLSVPTEDSLLKKTLGDGIQDNKTATDEILIVRGSLVHVALTILISLLISTSLFLSIFIFTNEIGEINNNIIILLFTVIQLLQAGSIFYLLYVWSVKKYTIYNGHIIVSNGFIRKTKKTFSLQNIESVERRQSFWKRMLGYGNIKVCSVTFDNVIWLRNIPEPKRVEHFIQNELKKES